MSLFNDIQCTKGEFDYFLPPTGGYTPPDEPEYGYGGGSGPDPDGIPGFWSKGG